MSCWGGGVKADVNRASGCDRGYGARCFVRADLGCTLNERVPVLAWLLNEAIAAASVSTHEPVRDAAERMWFFAGDSCQSAVP